MLQYKSTYVNRTSLLLKHVKNIIINYFPIVWYINLQQCIMFYIVLLCACVKTQSNFSCQTNVVTQIFAP